ncbi:mitochondrial ribosomal subunit protein-domain-containing protein [Apodospora peruviana]|uniref:Small ribosomal subunit protein mS35 n=1 Tax=Apodospora peruviana TaxID=516989 RepID=A0AAE0I180_9PEZI|nr:mitochondrial ribosomal subunit protein-domain-containing protein [Apodospora peruviana]
MASAANSLRLCLRSCSQLPTMRAARPAILASSLCLRRALSTTPLRGAAAEETTFDEDEFLETKRYNNQGEVLADMLKREDLDDADRARVKDMLETWNKVPQDVRDQIDATTRQVRQSTAQIRYQVKPKKASFWNDDEKDTDMITDEVGEDDFEEDDILSIGHAKLEEHREAREYARIAVWEMPLLTKFARPFEPPTEAQPLRFRYTSYMGEFHPAERKVVVEFSPKDFPGLTEPQQLKLMKLAGPRYNPDKGLVKMSCERFEHQAQNKRYLGDLVQKMIATAQVSIPLGPCLCLDPTDMFEDVPLDTRHHKLTSKPRFPKEWRMSEERRAELESIRRTAFELDQKKQKSGRLVDGVKIIEKHLQNVPVMEDQPVMARRVGKQPARKR